MQGPWEAMLTFSEGAKLKDARQNLRMQGYPWESCSSLLRGLTVADPLGGPPPPVTANSQGTVNPQSKDEQLSQGYPCILKFCLASLGFAPSENVNIASQGPCILIAHPYSPG